MIPTAKSLFELFPQGGLKSENILDFSIPVNPLGPSKRAGEKAENAPPGGASDIRILGMGI